MTFIAKYSKSNVLYFVRSMLLSKKKSVNEIEKLFKENHALLCLISFGILQDEEAAKDVVQDFFTSYFERSTLVSINSSFKAYAIGAVKKISYQRIKKKKKEKELLKCVSCTTHETPQIINLSEQENNAEKVLSQLPKSRREIFIDAIINGQSYADIAESKGISINTVKTQIKRAYALLRKESTKQLLRVLLLLITSVIFLFKDDF